MSERGETEDTPSDSRLESTEKGMFGRPRGSLSLPGRVGTERLLDSARRGVFVFIIVIVAVAVVAVAVAELLSLSL